MAQTRDMTQEVVRRGTLWNAILRWVESAVKYMIAAPNVAEKQPPTATGLQSRTLAIRPSAADWLDFRVSL
jgi:hypothetical protein